MKKYEVACRCVDGKEACTNFNHLLLQGRYLKVDCDRKKKKGYNKILKITTDNYHNV